MEIARQPDAVNGYRGFDWRQTYTRQRKCLLNPRFHFPPKPQAAFLR